MKYAVGTLAVVVHQSSAKESPVTKVLNLLDGLKSRIEADGEAELKVYDKAAAWCEDTLLKKNKAIDDAEEFIKELSEKAVKLSAETATHKAEIAQLEKEIAENKQSQAEATESRDKTHAEYSAIKTEAEQALGALEAAIAALAGAGEGKNTGFLSTVHEAQLLSVTAGIRRVMSMSQVADTLTDDEMKVVSTFVSQPAKFLQAKSLSAVQIQQNPFGDYAPASGQIQGILKGMEDTFEETLKKENAEEAEAVENYDKLMSTKKQELSTLEGSHKQHTADLADKSQKLTNAKQTRDEVTAQMKADEKFVAETKVACQDRAKEWSERSRLRTEELQGVHTALNILSDPEAQKTFESADTTFLQRSAVTEHVQKRAFSKKTLEFVRAHPALAALAMQSNGHFDKVITAVDKMIADLRDEEADDIAHRDRCQKGLNKNANDKEDLQNAIKQAEEDLQSMDDEKKSLMDQITQLEKDMDETKQNMEDALSERNDDHANFKQAQKDDTEGVRLLTLASEALAKFYKKNKIALIQNPEHTVDPDKMPDAPGGGKDYGGRKSDNNQIVSMIEMIKEDLVKELKTGKEEEAESYSDYKKERAAMQETYDRQHDTKATTEKNLATLKGKIADLTTWKESREGDLGNEGKLADSLAADCDWIDTHFDARRTKRQAEVDGLVEAKNFLAGGGN